MPEPSAIDLPTDLKYLLGINLQLAALIEPLKMILAMERLPGVSERIEAFLSEITRIGERIDRAATSMERALAVDTQVNELVGRQERTERIVAGISQDLSRLLNWLSVPPSTLVLSIKGRCASGLFKGVYIGS